MTEADRPAFGERVTVTRDLIESGASAFGGWSRAQVEGLGVPWPLRPGWISRACGTAVSAEAAREFLRQRDAHLGPLDVENARNRAHMRAILAEAPGSSRGRQGARR